KAEHDIVGRASPDQLVRIGDPEPKDVGEADTLGLCGRGRDPLRRDVDALDLVENPQPRPVDLVAAGAASKGQRPKAGTSLPLRTGDVHRERNVRIPAG